MYCGRTDGDVTILTSAALTENTQYFFRIYAENKYGRSEPLESEYPVVPKRVFGKYRFDVSLWVGLEILVLVCCCIFLRGWGVGGGDLGESSELPSVDTTSRLPLPSAPSR